MCPSHIRQVLAGLFFVGALWSNCASAAQFAKLGSAETVVGGQLVLIEEPCTFNGLGSGYTLLLLNPRGTTIGKGCAMTDALPSELGMTMVQWGSSPVRGAETYKIDDFTWSPRGRAVMRPVLAARAKAIENIQSERNKEAMDRAAEKAMVAALNSPGAEKTYLGVAGIKEITIITPKQCRVMVEAKDQPKANTRIMEWNNKGRTTLGLTSSGERVFQRGCALPMSDGSIKVLWDYHHEKPELFAANQIRWEPKGQAWIDVERDDEE